MKLKKKNTPKGRNVGAQETVQRHVTRLVNEPIRSLRNG